MRIKLVVEETPENIKEFNCGRHCRAVINATKRQEKLLMEIKMDIENLKNALDTANAQTQKIIGEIQELQAAVANSAVDLPPEVEEKVNQLLGNLQVADDLNPDAPQ